jgi:antitoxin MazE
METKVRKWGNSLAVRVPKKVADSLRLKEGARVRIEADPANQTAQIRQVSAKPVYTLKQLLKGVTLQKIHREIDWGKPAGRELW